MPSYGVLPGAVNGGAQRLDASVGGWLLSTLLHECYAPCDGDANTRDVYDGDTLNKIWPEQGFCNFPTTRRTIVGVRAGIGK